MTARTTLRDNPCVLDEDDDDAFLSFLDTLSETISRELPGRK